MGSGITPDQCKLPQLAFCDTFQTIVGGGREGDLDPAKWSFTRPQPAPTRAQGLVNNYQPFNAEFCMTHQVRVADNDSFICGQQFGESNHWMEGMDDGGQYVMNSTANSPAVRLRRPHRQRRVGRRRQDRRVHTASGTRCGSPTSRCQGPHLDHPGTPHLSPATA